MTDQLPPRPTFLGLEPLIIVRLEALIKPLGVRILSAAEVSVAREKALPVPSVRVAFIGHRINGMGSKAPGMRQIEQTWLVMPAVRNVREIRQGAASRAEISPLVDAIWDALDGWRPGHGYDALTAVTPPFASATIEGVTYVPLAFTSRFMRIQPCP